MLPIEIRVVVVLLAVAFGASSANSQTVANSNNTGYPENAIVQGTEIESVQATNGNLHIQIPIYSSAGRGLGVAYWLLLDSKGWAFSTQCANGICTDHPTPDQ